MLGCFWRTVDVLRYRVVVVVEEVVATRGAQVRRRGIKLAILFE